ncbi:LLM class flavin-dependent oxidoreductase [Phycicoccus sonneratiae]|uniref:LLM class flavin-dependent oxidoreductase n=1 Tax=Phycicoccus sonneratiae TaxID=2807628 RepID=A0ABS2CNC8_9MICO|nr:LLM class flavin-dependent oxidoreductase [Phycicoccus sonneraticus]MBM6401392.1 LLM class flavin-dependent oxidoreductase [Phycicoccus sonneraticus]
MAIPDPALVVLVGASGSGKSTWAAQRYRPAEVVSSDGLRGVVGSGPADLDASTDAFAVLEAVVSARVGRRLTTVVDTLGFDTTRRRSWLTAARAAGLPAVAVVVTAPTAVCRQRNAARDRPVPAKVLAQQLRQLDVARADLAAEGWDDVVVVDTADTATAPSIEQPSAAAAPDGSRRTSTGVEVVLQLSRFPWGEDPLGWLRSMALAADEAGFSGLALMDHLVQIPQVGRAWETIPEPWVALGALAGLGTGLRLGTLVTPVTFRPAGVTAKAAATLSALTGGRAFLGVGAGWWEREHAGFGVPFPTARERLDTLDRSIRTMRALWAAGTKPYDDGRVSLPETTCYPRPVGPVPVLVGGNGEHRTLRIAAELGDGCNLTTTDPTTLSRKVAALHQHCADVGRPPDQVAVTVLDVPVVGRDRDDVWARVERLRGRTAASTFAARSHAGTVGQHRDRHAELAALGVSTVFLTTPDLGAPDDVLALADLVR